MISTTRDREFVLWRLSRGGKEKDRAGKVDSGGGGPSMVWFLGRQN